MTYSKRLKVYVTSSIVMSSASTSKPISASTPALSVHHGVSFVAAARLRYGSRFASGPATAYTLKERPAPAKPLSSSEPKSWGGCGAISFVNDVVLPQLPLR